MCKQKNYSPFSNRLYRSFIFRFFFFIFCIFIPFEIFLIYFIEHLRIYFGYTKTPQPEKPSEVHTVKNDFEIQKETVHIPEKTPVLPVQKEKIADDLQAITGIGKKTAEILKNAGISTFSVLAASSVEQLNDILSQAGSRVKANDNWINQAKSLL